MEVYNGWKSGNLFGHKRIVDCGMSETRRRFYRVQPNFKHNPSDYAFLNEDDVLLDGCPVGLRAYRFASHRHPVCYGNLEIR